MRRLIPAAAIVLLTAACSSGSHVPPSQPSASASASPSPSTTDLPDDVMLSLSAISSDMKKITRVRDDDAATYAADCQKLGTDASSASVETIPNPAWQAQWRKAMGELQKGADECSSGQSIGDRATLQQALTDVTAANDDLQTFLKMTG